MDARVTDLFKLPTFQVDNPRRDKVDRGSVAPHLELTVERVLQGGRRCQPCAAVHGRYVCEPSAKSHREWRHTEAGLDVVVSLLERKPQADPQLRAMILVEVEGRVHARAIYVSEPLAIGLVQGPWSLKLISEESECDFAFPGQVEIVANGDLLLERELERATSLIAERQSFATNTSSSACNSPRQSKEVTVGAGSHSRNLV